MSLKKRATASLNRPYNGGTMTEAMFRSFIISHLRAASRWWKPRNDVIKKAREARGLYRCAECKQLVPASLPPPPGKKRRIKNVLADHIDPIV